MAVSAIIGVGLFGDGAARAQEVAHFRQDPAMVEANILTVLNQMRANPTVYVEALRTYRGYFRDKIVSLPGSELDVETHEGTAPVDEVIALLGQQRPLQTIAPGTTLRLAALDHVHDQGATGTTGHFDSKGLGPAQRNQRHGGGKQIAEVIAYGAGDADEVIRELIVDDGVGDRGHRAVLFSGHLRYAGIACGPHPTFGTMCVIDLSDTPDGTG